MILLHRAGAPRRDDGEGVGSLVDQFTGQLGESDVVAGDEADPEPGQLHDDRCVSRRDELGLPGAERVEQVDLPVGPGEPPRLVERDGRVEDPAVAGRLEDARDDGDAVLPGRVGEPGDERAVERLGGLRDAPAEPGERRLGENGQVGAFRLGESVTNGLEVRLRIVVDGDLAQGYAGHGSQSAG